VDSTRQCPISYSQTPPARTDCRGRHRARAA
jgi:hypothetical protein